MKRCVAALCALLCLLAAPGALAESCPFAREKAPGYAALRTDGEPVDGAWFADALMIGDSITESLWNYDVLPELAIYAVIGQSPQGAMNNINDLDGKYQTMVDLVRDKQPAKLLVMLGSNGLDLGSVEKVLGDYHALLDALLEAVPGAQIYLLSVLPVREKVRERYRRLNEANIAAFNEGLLALASMHGVYYIDAHTPLLDGAQIAQAYCAGDGMHLNQDGAQAVADAICAQAGR